jgi:hypothetical protein
VNMRKINLEDSIPSSDNPSLPDEKPEETAVEVKGVVDETVVSDNNDNPMTSPFAKMTIIISVVAIAAGVATGYGGFKLKSKSGGSLLPRPSELQRVAEEGQIEVGDIFGVKDEKTFKDSAEGYLEIGGIDGEGSHKITRPGGVSQTVYLTSSITDLDKFDGMEVKIWGETFKGQKAGWLMDVGRIEILNPDSQAPSEE